MRIREPRQPDAGAMGALHVRAWQRAYRGGLMPDAYLDQLSVEERVAMWTEALAREPRPRSTRYVAEADDGTVVGFLVAGPEGGDEAAAVGEVYVLNVDPDAWGTGAGRALLEAGTSFLGEAGFAVAVLWVVPGNQRARRFYERDGWVDDGAQREEEVLGVTVPEMRYRRVLDRAHSATR
jgi:ribosomal protein S18 acetylase RimI-like enzyme